METAGLLSVSIVFDRSLYQFRRDISFVCQVLQDEDFPRCFTVESLKETFLSIFGLTMIPDNLIHRSSSRDDRRLGLRQRRGLEKTKKRKWGISECDIR